jgi:cell division protein FtsN
MDFLKNIGVILVSLTIGFGIAGYLNDPKKPSPWEAVKGTFSSLKALFSEIPEAVIDTSKLSQESMQKEGTPTPGITMTDSEVTEAQKYFNKLAGIDVEKREKQKQEKEKREKEEQEKQKKEADQKEEKPTLKASSLFVVKKRDSMNHSMTHGAVYALGTSPYGPPPSVKYKIFEKGSLLSIESDPTAMDEKESGHLDSYQKPSYPLPLMKNAVQNTTLPVLDPKNTFTLQLGSFEQEADADEFKQKLQSKGYDVGVYKDRTHKDQSWFYVRLNAALTERESHQYKDRIAKDVSLSPIIVLVEDDVRSE